MRKVLRIAAIAIWLSFTLALIIYALNNPAQAESQSITIINPGEMMLVKLNTKTASGEDEIILIEFDERGQGAIMSQFDRSRILAITNPNEVNDLDGLEFHYFKTVSNFFKRTDFDKLMREIDEGKISAWDKVKYYAEKGGAFTWDKTQDFVQWMNDTADSMADYAIEKNWGDKLQELFKFGDD